MASDSPSATTPRTTGSRQTRWRAIGDAIGWLTCAISPSGFRTATDQFDGPRIITPSRTACPPTVVIGRSFQTDVRAELARPDLGTASGALEGLSPTVVMWPSR